MNLQRITRIQVLGVWVILVVAVALLFFFMVITPQRKAIKSTNDQAEAAEAEAAKRPAAEKALEAAKKAEAEVTMKYQKILDTRMPKLDFSDPIASTVRMWDFADEEERLMERWFASTGARVSGYGFNEWGTAMPASFPKPDWPQLDPQNWNLTVEVRDFTELLNFLLKIPQAPRFMVMQNVTIAGPREAGQPLVATIPVTLYEWTGVLPSSVGAATTAGATGAGAAAGGAGGAGGAAGAGGAGGPRGGMGRGGRGGMGGGGPRGGMGRGGMGGGGPRGGMGGGRGGM
ncbi:MAG: hypothetical protein ACE149_12130 [Armatimonadota bacterium]